MEILDTRDVLSEMRSAVVMEIITPAGLALCAALGITCQSSFDLEVALPPHQWIDREHRQIVPWSVPAEMSYDRFISCPDKLSGQKSCGDGMQCVVIGEYKIYGGSVGHTRVCRERS